MRCSSSRMRAASVFRGVAIQHRHHGLLHDRAGIEPLIDKMHGAAGKFDAVLDRLVLRVEPGNAGSRDG